eukprot:CAMPEP_0117520118 /NCGR_PEP_ID=MMETSP0784-20121206/33006_1 /TAXON_ID=39447 /ORGANISM="" /LENGTH=501 /DNA_ID=CAMNT_0005316107 /DNA_START=101 /DNA_END=1602 /DNA_ORIENTATION=+
MAPNEGALFGGGMGALREKMQKIWQALGDQAFDTTDEAKLRAFVAQTVATFNVSERAFGNISDTFQRFDFDGNGRLEFNEACQCVKFVLVEHRRELGGASFSRVPHKTPTEVGCELIRVLAAGGQGEARLVRVGECGREMCLKVYQRGNENAGGLDELVQEMRHLQRVASCEHIGHCQEIFQDEDCFYMLGDYFSGGDFVSLRTNLCAAGVALNEEFYRRIFKQVFQGLEYMHQQALMHCDIKEPNLMLKTSEYSRPEAVIIDLGLSQVLFDGLGACGSPGYIPPETWETEKWYPRGDIFSMGVVCFQLFADMVPSGEKEGLFTEGAKDLDDVMRITETRQPPYEMMEFTGPSVMEWLGPCLDKKRERRLTAPRVLELPWFQGSAPPAETPASDSRAHAATEFRRHAVEDPVTLGVESTTPEVLCTWMWGDLWAPAYLNAFRWAKRKGIAETIAQLRGAKCADRCRPVILRTRGEESKHDSAEEAACALEALASGEPPAKR